MESIQKAQGVLADAEKSLRDLMEADLAAQRYYNLAALARMADGLARLAAQAGSDSDSPSGSLLARSAPEVSRTSVAASRRGTSKTRRGAYPKFERDSDKLVKIGWSKKRREEYEHRAPRSAVLAFMDHLFRVTEPGRTFAIDEILPAHDATGDELPGYQVYLVLAWLREMRAVEKRGRDGYVVTHPQPDGNAFDALWNETAARG